MNSLLISMGISVFLPIAPAPHTAVVFESGNQGALWNYGSTTAQQVASVVQPAGSERRLRTVTLHGFMHSAGKFRVTVAVYQPTEKLGEADKLEKPLWKKDVEVSYGQHGGDDVRFDKLRYTLPDKFVLSFSFVALPMKPGRDAGLWNGSNNGWIGLRLDGKGAPGQPVNPPTVGSLAAQAVYNANPTPASWGWDAAGQMGTLYVDAKIEAEAKGK